MQDDQSPINWTKIFWADQGVVKLCNQVSQETICAVPIDKKNFNKSRSEGTLLILDASCKTFLQCIANPNNTKESSFVYDLVYSCNSWFKKW